MKRIGRAVAPILVAVVLLVLLMATPVMGSPQYGRYPVMEYLRISRDLDVQGTMGVDGAAVLSTVTTSGNAEVGGTLGVTGAATLSGKLTLEPSAVVTLTTNGAIPVTRNVVLLSAAGAVGTSNISAGPAGMTLYLLNTANQTITISDTATLKLGGNAALGQFDTLTLVSDGTNWLQVAKTDN